MKVLEVSDRTVDRAIFKGLGELGLSIDEVEIEILQEDSKGILGIGRKDAIVRLTQKPEEEVVAPDFAELARRDNRERDRFGAGRQRDGERGGRGNRRRSGEQRRAPERAPQQRREEPPVEQQRDSERPHGERTAAPAAKAPAPVTTQEIQVEQPAEASARRDLDGFTLETAQAEPGAVFIDNVLKRIGVEAVVTANNADGDLLIHIESTSTGLIIAHRGETLDALQYLASLVVNKNRSEGGYRRVTVDIADYRKRREDTLVKLARRMAQQVRQSGRSKTLEPMNPYERRILHSALQSNSHVTTHSVGEEPNRRVVIAPKRRRSTDRVSRGDAPIDVPERDAQE
ncbi:MAG: RNA-binding cell elongation regulator Jag/EloR [Clostridia bacterium]|nr:RNA-binding cell elongation regulator Jag/EloR [Clostridia bacterium]